jgi:CHAT domain-containing protein
MASRSGRNVPILEPLLFALLFLGVTAAAPRSYEGVWRDAQGLIQSGEAPAALKIVDDALQRAGASDDEWVWALRITRASLIHRSDPAKARAIIDTPLPPKLRNSETAARRQVVLAMMSYVVDDARYLAHIDEACAIAAKHAPAYLPDALALRSVLAGSAADAAEAVRLARKGGNPQTIATVGGNVVITHIRAGRYAEAIALDAPVRAHLKALGMRRFLARHLGNIGWAYGELGDYDQAMELLTIAERESAQMGEVDARLTFLNNIGHIHRARREWEAASRAYATVLQTAAKDHREHGLALANLARISIDSGEPAEARDAIRRALAFERANKDIEDELIARILEARVDAATGRYAEAEKTLRHVMNTSVGPITRFEAQARLAKLLVSTGRNDLALTEFKRAVDLVRTARESINSPELRISYFNTSSDLFDDYIDFLVATKRPEEALRVTEISRAQTLAEGLVTAQAKLDPQAIAKARNATILCYWLGHNRSWVWTINANAITVAPLPADHVIEAEVDRYGKVLLTAAGTLDRSGARGQRLYNILVAPAVRGLPRNARVIVVADGKLHTLNFETLVVPATPQRYWINDVVLTNASSLQLLSPGAPRPRAASPMLLVGNPPAVDAAFPPLRQAPVEIARVAARFAGATVLQGPKATPAGYAAAKPQRFDLVHFVAHGVAARRRPLDSAVILGLDAKKSYRLLARDIAEQPLSARLVTISSCEGAGYATYTGEGLVGLAWAFRRAGAEQVVAALWRVDDMATLELMDRMYEGISAKRDPAVALREAKLALLGSGTAFKQPKHWAPFINYL